MNDLAQDASIAKNQLNAWENAAGEDERAEIYEQLCQNKSVTIETLSVLLNGRSGYIGDYASDPCLGRDAIAHDKMREVFLKKLKGESTSNVLTAAKIAQDPLPMSILEILTSRTDYDLTDVVSIISEWRVGNHSDWVREQFGNKLAECNLETLIRFLVPLKAKLLAIKKSLLDSEQKKTDTEVYMFFKILDERFERWDRNNGNCRINHGSRLCLHGHGKFDIAYALTFRQEAFLLKHAKRCSTEMLVNLLTEIIAEKLPDDKLCEAVLHALAERKEYSAEKLLSMIKGRGFTRVKGMTYLMAREDFPLEKQLAEFKSNFVLYDICDRARMAAAILKKIPNPSPDLKLDLEEAISVAEEHKRRYAWLTQYPRIYPQT